MKKIIPIIILLTISIFSFSQKNTPDICMYLKTCNCDTYLKKPAKKLIKQVLKYEEYSRIDTTFIRPEFGGKNERLGLKFKLYNTNNQITWLVIYLKNRLIINDDESYEKIYKIIRKSKIKKFSIINRENKRRGEWDGYYFNCEVKL